MKGFVAVLMAMLACPASAQTTTPDFTDRFIHQRGAIQPLSSAPFGENISLYVGRVEFSQTDISIPGNNSLPVSLSRRYVPFSGYQRDEPFVDWQLDIPNIHGIFTQKYEWTVSSGGPSNQRCSQYGPPLDGEFVDGSLSKSETFWDGTQVYLPGSGDQELLRGSPAVVPDGNSYPLTTADGSIFRCLSALASGSEGTGEGFLMLRPDGTTIRFDYMVSRFVLPQENSSGSVLRLKEYRMLPTVVSDRFGNTVTYTWSGRRLVSIVASDGRRIDTTGNPITSATDGTRTWTYQYSTQSGNSYLSAVVLPDGTSWGFSLNNFYYGNPPVYAPIACNEDGSSLPLSGSSIGTIVNPSGVTGEFTIQAKAHGRSWVPMDCRDLVPSNSGIEGGYAYYPRIFGAWSLTQRKLTGPGLPAQGQVWTYAYGPPNHCWSSGYSGASVVCNSNSPTTKTVEVTAPDGAVKRYTFGNRYEVNEGLLLQTDEGWNGTSALRTTVNTYAAYDAGPYPSLIGSSMQARSDGPMSARYRPLRATSTTQQGRVFTWEVATGCSSSPYCFDERARPTKVVKSSGF
ncbi:hypothetical protein [Pseudoxanthomonas winnipegensis]|uniref:hypothetical protein n=1 Tax=Pseudoxanthomonas winnipegensis TaxID=2480810 RepID=UPI0030F3A44A